MLKNNFFFLGIFSQKNLVDSCKMLIFAVGKLSTEAHGLLISMKYQHTLNRYLFKYPCTYNI